MASFNRPFNTTDRAPPCRAEGGQSSPPFTHATPGRQSTAPTPLDPVHAFLDERLLPVASSSPKGLGAASYCAPPPGERKSSRFVRFVRSKGHRGGPSGSRLGGLVADVCDSANNVATAAPPGGGHGSLIREGRMSRSLRLAAVAALGMAASFALPAGALVVRLGYSWRLHRECHGRGGLCRGSDRLWRSIGTVRGSRCAQRGRPGSRRSGPGRCGRSRVGSLCR